MRPTSDQLLHCKNLLQAPSGVKSEAPLLHSSPSPAHQHPVRPISNASSSRKPSPLCLHYLLPDSLATVALSILLDLDLDLHLPACDIGGPQALHPCQAPSLYLACHGQKVTYGTNWLAYDKLGVLILTTKMKKQIRSMQVPA